MESLKQGINDQLNSASIKNEHALFLIVGDEKISICDHETFNRFKLWVAEKLTQGTVETYQYKNFSIEHIDDEAKSAYPHLLNPCECGTYLPLEIDPCPMLSSAIGLLRDLTHLNQYRDEMEPDFVSLMDAMIKMAERSLDKNIALEIR